MIAVEILSRGEEIERKLTLYFQEGALEVWLIDTQRRTLTVYLLRNDQVVRLVVKTEYRSEAAGVTVSLADLFA
jgi:Uma2 family endonuclease